MAKTFVLVLTEIKGHPFASSTQERVVPAIARARLAASRATKSAVEIAGSGAIQHASAAAMRAKQEIATFGTIESIAVVLLLLLVFGSMRPLLLGVLTLGAGYHGGVHGSAFRLRQVHILALVFGSSLIGSVIDYSIHFFADRFRDPAQWTPASAVPHVGPAILLGLTTTLIGYLVLAAVPFPGPQADRRVLHDRVSSSVAAVCCASIRCSRARAAICRNWGRSSARRSIAD